MLQSQKNNFHHFSFDRSTYSQTVLWRFRHIVYIVAQAENRAFRNSRQALWHGGVTKQVLERQITEGPWFQFNFLPSGLLCMKSQGLPLVMTKSDKRKWAYWLRFCASAKCEMASSLSQCRQNCFQNNGYVQDKAMDMCKVLNNTQRCQTYNLCTAICKKSQFDNGNEQIYVINKGLKCGELIKWVY